MGDSVHLCSYSKISPTIFPTYHTGNQRMQNLLHTKPVIRLHTKLVISYASKSVRV